MQERQATTRKEILIEHSDDTIYLINTYAIHNATLLRQALPQHLIAPVALYSDRETHHKELAVTLRTTQKAKRARTQEKRKATMAAKQAKKRQRDPDVEDSGGEEGENEQNETEPVIVHGAVRAGKRKKS